MDQQLGDAVCEVSPSLATVVALAGAAVPATTPMAPSPSMLTTASIETALRLRWRKPPEVRPRTFTFPPPSSLRHVGACRRGVASDMGSERHRGGVRFQCPFCLLFALEG